MSAARKVPRITRVVGLAILTAVWIFALGCDRQPCSPRAERPSVVVILIDTLRADRLGPTTTPRIDAWAAGGKRCTRAVAASPWTGPSVASIVTGRYPDELGLQDLDDPLPRAAETLAESFAAAGWNTGAIVSNGYIAPWFGHDQGYAYFHKEEYMGDDDGPDPVATADRVTDEALSWLATASAPYFLYVHYTDPHDPYLPPPEWAARFVADPSVLPRDLLRKRAFAQTALTPEQFAALKGMYDASVAFADDAVGRLLDALPADALVVVVGDHGEEFLEHGGFVHGHTVFEELVHVPLVFRGPGVCAGTTDLPVSHVDIGPTLLDLAGVPPLTDPTGRSLATPLGARGPAGEDGRILFSVRAFGNDKLVAARRGSWKFLLEERTGRMALFDLGADPGERRDVAGEHADIARTLEAAIRDRAGRLRDAPPLDDEEMQRRRIQALRSLGYVN